MSVEVAASSGSGADLAKSNLRSQLVGFGWAGLSVAIFSGWLVVTRFSVTHELRIWDIIALRFGGGALVLLPVLFGPSRRLSRQAWTEGLLFSALWGAPFVFLVALGLRLGSASEVASITPGLMPVFAGLLAWAVLREPPGSARLFGYGAIVGGVIVLVVGGTSSYGPPNLSGLAALILAAIMWAIYGLRFRRSSSTPMQAAALICFWSAALYLPIYGFFGLSRLGSAGLLEIAFQAVYQGLLMGAFAVITFNRAVTLLGPRAAAAIIALLPVVTTAMAVPILGEVPTRLDGAAMVLIAAGVIFAARPAQTLKRSPARHRVPKTIGRW